MFFIRIAGLLTGILLVAAFALLPEQDRFAGLLKAVSARFAPAPAVQAGLEPTGMAQGHDSPKPAPQIVSGAGAHAPGEEPSDNETAGASAAVRPAQETERPAIARQALWKPFNARAKAEGFARHVSSLCDIACEVEQHPDGYRIYIVYHETAERDRAIACMEARAGVRPVNDSAGRGFAD